MKKFQNPFFVGTSIFLVVILVLWAIPQYRVYSARLEGKAELMRAEQNRQIKIQEASAAEEAAKYLKRAEITRAEGVASATKIIGEGLQSNKAYLHYLWLQGLADNDADVIYVPTESNMPITEAGRTATMSAIKNIPSPATPAQDE
jgi:hypothetical protein